MRHREIRDGIGRWWRPSRHKPPGHVANAAAAHGERHQSGLPGPPGDINTARHATDTWPGRPPGNLTAEAPAPRASGPGARGTEREVPAGGSGSSG